jgi:hypothetical protein
MGEQEDWEKILKNEDIPEKTIILNAVKAAQIARGVDNLVDETKAGLAKARAHEGTPYSELKELEDEVKERELDAISAADAADQAANAADVLMPHSTDNYENEDHDLSTEALANALKGTSQGLAKCRSVTFHLEGLANTTPKKRFRRRFQKYLDWGSQAGYIQNCSCGNVYYTQ